MAQSLEERFTVSVVSNRNTPSMGTGWTYIYGPGRPFRARNSRAVSSVRTGPPTCRKLVSNLGSYIFGLDWHDGVVTYHLSGPLAFFPGDFLDRALYLRNVDGLVLHFNYATQDRSHFRELVLVPRDEVELGQSHDAGTGWVGLDEWALI